MEGGGGDGGNDFLPKDDAQADLNKASCYKLLGFSSAGDAQKFFNSITFHYGSYGNLTLKNGTPATLPAPANTLGFGQVNINTDYNWADFSKVSTSTGSTFDFWPTTTGSSTRI